MPTATASQARQRSRRNARGQLWLFDGIAHCLDCGRLLLTEASARRRRGPVCMKRYEAELMAGRQAAGE